MADLGDDLWRHSEDGKTASIRLVALKYTVRCESKVTWSQRATVGVECRDKIGHPIWRKDFCDEHERRLVARARALGVDTVFIPPSLRYKAFVSSAPLVNALDGLVKI